MKAFSTTESQFFSSLRAGNQDPLVVGKKYSIKNGYLTGDIWMENVYLTDVEDCGGFNLYTFTFGNGSSKITIDGDFLYKFSRDNNMMCYQYIES